MEGLLGVLVIAALIGAVVWNHKNAEAALDGVEFSTPHSPATIVTTIAAAYCGGAKARAKSLLSGCTVTQTSPTSFRLETKIGDIGQIDVRQHEESGAVIAAYTTELYVGSHPVTHFRKGFAGLAADINHRLYKLLGISPNAAKMKRFQVALEGRIARQLRSSPQRN